MRRPATASTSRTTRSALDRRLFGRPHRRGAAQRINGEFQSCGICFEGIARRAKLVVYDPRGFGLSDRGPMDYSCEAMVRDLEAVADAAAAGPFTLQTFGYMSIPALAYAARHPGRVMALVLLNGILRAADMSESWRRLVRLAGEDWEYATTLIVRTNEASYTSTATLATVSRSCSRGNNEGRVPGVLRGPGELGCLGIWRVASTCRRWWRTMALSPPYPPRGQPPPGRGAAERHIRDDRTRRSG